MPLDYGWGGSAWGSNSWGVGFGGMGLLSATPVRDNVARLGFSMPVKWTNLGDEGDSAQPEHYTFVPDPDAIGYDGEPARLVMPIYAVLADFEGSGGFFVDVVFDRAMGSFPGRYFVTVTDVFAVDGTPTDNTITLPMDALYRALVPPTPEIVVPSRDFANPQSLQAASADPSLPNPTQAVLGSFNYDGSGDYAIDQGLTNLKKRIIRRLMTRTGAFAHLPGYGVGFLAEGKRLSTPGIRQRLAADAEKQIMQEPEVTKARVQIRIDPAAPSVVRYLILVRTRAGKTAKFEVPVPFAAAA